MKGLKIWFISPFSPLPGEGCGGVKTHAEYLARLLAEMGADLTVLVPEGISKAGRTGAGFVIETIPGSGQPHTAPWAKAMKAAAERLLAVERPDLVISESYYARGCEEVLERAGIPLAAFVHNFHLVHYQKTLAEVAGPRQFLRYLLKAVPDITLKMLGAEAPFLRRAGAVISVSERNAALLRDFYRIGGNRLFVLHNWVDISVFKNSPELRTAGRSCLGLPEGSICYLGAGALWRPKGFHVAISAFKLIAERCPGAVLMLAGDGPDARDLKEQAGPLLAAGRVRFLGEVPLAELPGIYNAADVFLIPSTHPEGLAYTLIEAMACGLPAIATGLGGNIETLGGLGTLVPSGDERRLAGAMLDLAENPVKRQEQGDACRRRAEEFFSEAAARKALAAILGTFKG